MVLKLSIVLCFFISLADAQVTLQPWVEVFGTVNQQQLGVYVLGIVPSANLPFRAAVSTHPNEPNSGITRFYRLNSPTDTASQLILSGENPLIGDLNNDGFKDVVIGKSVSGYDTVYIYWGTSTGIDTLNPLRIPGENQFDGLLPATIGDINNDGHEDLILAARRYPNFPIYGKIYIFLSPIATSNPSVTITGDSVYAGLGWAASIGDLNNDGLNDLIVRGVNQVLPLQNRYDYVNIYFGVGIDTVNTRLGLHMRTKFLALGGLACFDVNGDGKSDLLWTTADSAGQYVNVHFGRTNFQTNPDVRLVPPFFVGDFGFALADAGDMNGDGYHDLIMGSPFASSAAGIVIEYSGGPRIDPYFDAAVAKDFDGYFGQSVATVGDINGDGLSDIIVGAPRYAFLADKGYWGIFKGDSAIRVTDVPQPLAFPTEFELHDAYPNPFNPVTRIEFGLRTSAHVTIDVVDLLGRQVRTLVDENYSIGEHSTEFDGSGLASGTYYYRMTVKKNGGIAFQQTKGLTLLK